MPLLLVKQFAFDLELLAVAKALGYGRIEELPVRLAYRFTGSALRSTGVLRALSDTAAVFYRLRILRTYQRKRRFVRGRPLAPASAPLVAVVGPRSELGALDYPATVSDAAAADLVAVVTRTARPAGNWLSAAVPYFADPAVAAVVTPTVAPLHGAVRESAAAAVLESRLGGGSRRARYLPGNVRTVTDFPAHNVVIRRGDLEAAHAAGIDAESLVAWLAARGRRTVYTPETSISEPPPPVFAPHLRGTVRHARARGAVARRTRGGSLSAATTLSLLPAALAAGGVAVATASKRSRSAGLALTAAYAGITAASSALAAVRFRSVAVGALAAPALVATHVAYVAGFVDGLLRER
jgi:hypothetical protein